MSDKIPKVYIPFEDGSAISFDGSHFTIHKQPVDIDANLSALSEGKAVSVWKEKRREIVNALQASWWKIEEQRKQKSTKTIYSKNANS